jgi:hypothetical protein
MSESEIDEAWLAASPDEKANMLLALANPTQNGPLVSYHLALQALADAYDRVVFSALDILINKYSQRLQADAEKLIPILLQKLSGSDSPIADRAAWALNIIGNPALDGLIEATSTATNNYAKSMYVWALGRNSSLYLQAERIASLLIQLLNDSNARVRFCAMASLMDNSPLRSWGNSVLRDVNLEPIYKAVLPVAKEFVASNNYYSEFALRYQQLIEQHFLK